ncbi:hypothetical protein WCX18_02785 [Sulfurimonas sp. HSL1-2]|uniref:hypothetical protein n=1 Tax=Thiomicrolovo zhangzhouensis TaxID=3131933 RepID=UPI0031FA27BD
MKLFMPIIVAGCILHVTAAASDIDTSSPSQNTELNAITPTGKIDPDKKGFLQRSYEHWEATEWEENTQPETAPEQDASSDAAPVEEAEVSKVTEDTAVETEPSAETAKADETTDTAAEPETDPEKSFTLQYYFDKWGRYLDNKEKNRTEPLHSEKLEKMPAIGK